MSPPVSQTSTQFAIGDRVLCVPAGLTGEIVGIQDESIGIRYDIGYIQWEAAVELRRAQAGEATGNNGLPTSDPLYADQQAKIKRSQEHTGFDNIAIGSVIAESGSQFRTRDISSHRAVLNAHPYAATQRNYHAMVGRHLRANEDHLGITLVSAAGHSRGALWRKTTVPPSPPQPPWIDDGPAVVPPTNGRHPLEDQIDRFLGQVGLDPAVAIDEHGWRRIGIGASNGLVGIVMQGDISYLRVLGSVIELPSDRELILPLLRDLLELNNSLPGPARAAIEQNSVVVAAMMPADGISDELVGFTIHNVLSMADSLIEPLKQQYGGTARHRNGHRR
jgi:hypothetical protein